MERRQLSNRTVNQVGQGRINQRETIRFRRAQGLCRHEKALTQHGLTADDHDFAHICLSRGGADNMLKLVSLNRAEIPGILPSVPAELECRKKDWIGAIGAPLQKD